MRRTALPWPMSPLLPWRTRLLPELGLLMRLASQMKMQRLIRPGKAGPRGRPATSPQPRGTTGSSLTRSRPLGAGARPAAVAMAVASGSSPSEVAGLRAATQVVCVAQVSLGLVACTVVAGAVTGAGAFVTSPCQKTAPEPSPGAGLPVRPTARAPSMRSYPRGGVSGAWSLAMTACSLKGTRVP